MRQKLHVWLDKNKPDELKLLKLIPGLKKSGLFTSTLRDGLRLIVDLRAGRLDVLLELYPWVQAAPPGYAGPTAAAPAFAATGGMITMKQIAMPTFDDDDTIVVRQDPNAAGRIMDNFMDSVFGLQ